LPDGSQQHKAPQTNTPSLRYNPLLRYNPFLRYNLWMSIQDELELVSLKASGRIVRMVIDAMKAEVRPGITTRQLDEIGARVMRENGAQSAPSMVYKFPGANCISLNDEAVHGVPGDRELRDGDLLKLDVTVEKDGFMADAAVTVPVGRVSARAAQLIACAERAFQQAMLVARAGFRVFEIGKMVEREVRKSGFSVVRELGGHGIGRTIHEAPHVPNYPDPHAQQIMKEGLVITVEPIIAMGSGQVFTDQDGWTVRTSDQTLSAHFEQTLVVTSSAPILLTA
jgi:methionyl aminopeptidase